MTKRLTAKVGEYQDSEGNTKGEYIKLGVILNNQNGDYILLDPTVNLAGVLTKQNILARTKQKQPSSSVMVSVFDDNNQQNSNNSQPAQQRQQPQSQNNQPSQNPDDFDFDDDIPF